MGNKIKKKINRPQLWHKIRAKALNYVMAVVQEQG